MSICMVDLDWAISKRSISFSRREKGRQIAPDVARRNQEVSQSNSQRAAKEIEDDQLRLMFRFCRHPAIDPPGANPTDAA